MEEGWAPKNWCFWTVALEKTLESPLDCKEIQPVHPKGNQSWIFIGGTNVEAETPLLWPPDVKNWLIGKDPHAGKDWRREEKGTREDEMLGWHHQLNGHESEQTPGVGDGQGGLACCSPWGCKESDTTEWLNWTDSFVWLYHNVIIHFPLMGIWIVFHFLSYHEYNCYEHFHLRLFVDISFHFSGVYKEKSNCWSHGNLMFNYLRNCRVFSKAAASFYIPTGNVHKFQLLHIFGNICYCLYFWLKPP